MPAPRKFKDPSKKQDIPEPQPRIRSVPVSKLVASPSGGRKEERPTQGLIKPDSPSITPRVQREVLKANWNALSGRVMAWLLEGDRLENELLPETKLRDLAVLMGISTEKVLLLEGQPTQIIAQPQQAVLDKLGPALAEVMKQRGLVKLTERTATIDLNGPPQQTS